MLYMLRPPRAGRGFSARSRRCSECIKQWQRGEVPEWLKGTDCKSVGFAYAGSNPALSTILAIGIPCLPYPQHRSQLARESCQVIGTVLCFMAA